MVNQLKTVDVVHDALVRSLARHEGNCVSVFLPTARGGVETLQGPVRLRNLRREAAEQLAAAGLDGDRVNEVLAPLDELADDRDFWQQQADSLAVFVADGPVDGIEGPAVLRLAGDLPEQVVVGHRFAIRPLLERLLGDDHFILLAVAQNSVRAFEASHQFIRELPGLEPTSLEEALAHEDVERQLQGRSAGRDDVRYHGHGSGGEGDKARVERFLRAVDDGLRDIVGATTRPIVLAAVEYYLPIYTQVTQFANVAPAAVVGNPERRQAGDLHAAALEVLDQVTDVGARDEKESFGALIGSGLTSTSLAELAAAVKEGRVATLYMPPATTVDLGVDLEELVTAAYANGADIRPLDHIEGLADRIAGIYRY